ncbi:MAG: serine/threonine-protein kinase, partial [Acidobacteriota bacterium]
MASQPGELLDNRYRLTEELGKGGMGVVWKARDLTLERTVAIKILRREILDAEAQERLKREARAAAQLTHPNIVTIFDVVLGSDNTYLVMQHVGGESLRTWQDRIDLSWTDVVELAKQLTAALIYSHASGIVHRDLKPENVMVTQRRAPRERGDADGPFPYHITLLDFGLAKPFESTRLTQSGIFVGTASYMSPEQVTGAAVDGRSDIYSLGVILFELVCKRRPFEGDSFQNILFRHVNEKPRPLSHINSGVDPELEQIVMRCLEKAPDRRFSDAEALLAELERVGRMLTARAPELVATSLAVAPAPAEKPAATVFIGREQELRDLRLRYQKAHMGEAQLVMLSGDAGVGKTRLWQELASQLSDSGTL